MNTNTQAVLIGLAVAVGYGVGDFWAARAAKKLGAITSLVAVDVIMLAVYAGAYRFLPQADSVFTASGVAYAVTAGIVLNIAAILFFKGLAAGPVSVVSPISAAYPLVSALIAMAAFGTKLSSLQLLAILVVVIGVMTASGLLSRRNGRRRVTSGPLLALASAVFYGIGFSCLAQSAQRLGWQHTTLVQFIVLTSAVLMCAPFVAKRERPFWHLGRALTNRFVLLSALITVITIAIFNLGFTHEHTAGAIIIAASACCPAITVPLALKHFNEDVHHLQLMGAFVSMAGVVMLVVG